MDAHTLVSSSLVHTTVLALVGASALLCTMLAVSDGIELLRRRGAIRDRLWRALAAVVEMGLSALCIEVLILLFRAIFRGT